MAEVAGVERSVSRRFSEAPLFLGVFTGQVVIGAAIALVPGNLLALLLHAQIVNGVITPILLTYVLTLANRRSVLGAAANGRAFRVLAGICVAGVATMSAMVVIDTCARTG